jgi:hypothetical protein
LFVEVDKMKEDAEEEGGEELGVEAVVVLFHLFHLVGILKDGMVVDLEVIAPDDGENKFHVVLVHVLDDAANLVLVGCGYGVLGRRKRRHHRIMDHMEERKGRSEETGG